MNWIESLFKIAGEVFRMGSALKNIFGVISGKILQRVK